jgi:hypothetical protein
MSQVMHHPLGTGTECAVCLDAAYEPGWYAVLRGTDVPHSHQCSGPDPLIDAPEEKNRGRGLFGRRGRQTVVV